MLSSKNADDLRESDQCLFGSPKYSTSMFIGCVVVTYRPDHAQLLREIHAISPQVCHIVLVDNGDGSLLPEFPSECSLQIVCLGSNQGIAKAQNIGIKHIRERGVSHVLLLDQDSLPSADMVFRLVEGLRQLQLSGLAVAAVGPQFYDSRQGYTSDFARREHSKLKQFTICETENLTVEVEFLIASGCLIPLEVVDVVGDMDVSLFIDYVDIEWSLRAQCHGYASYGVSAAHMEHNLGDEWIVYRGRRYPVHSPLRHYYFTRNSILLARLSWMPWPWRLILIKRMVKQLIFFSMFVGNKRFANARMMGRGVLHGVIGRRGKL